MVKAGTQSFAQKDAIQFHQQNFARLYKCIELEVMTNFYTVCSVLCASKFSINLLVQKLLVKKVVKLTPGQGSISSMFLHKVFTHADPESAKSCLTWLSFWRFWDLLT